MSLAHTSSLHVVRKELDLFSAPPTQVAIENGQWIEHNPISSLESSSTIEFLVSGSGDDYMDLSRTLLHLEVNIIGHDGGTLTSTDGVAFVNNAMQSLFSQQDISLNNTLISSSSMTHPYRSYIETLLNGGYDSKSSKLTAELFNMDSNLDHADPLLTSQANKGLASRFKLTQSSKVIDLIGPIHGDIFFQNRFIISGVDLKLRLTRAKDAFILSAKDEAIPYRAIIKSAKLFVRKVKVAAPMILAHEELLKYDTCKYPISRVELKISSIPAGNMSFSQDNIFLGQLPTRVIIGFIKNTAFNGKYSENPFNFEHMNLNFLSLHLDGQQIPSTPLKPSFSTNKSVRSYYSQFISGDHAFSNEGNCITRTMFENGYALYCFDLTPDLSSACSSHFNLIKTGNLRAEFGFETALPSTTNVIIFAEFDNIIEITKNRDVIYDFQN